MAHHIMSSGRIHIVLRAPEGDQRDNPFAPPPEGAPDRPWQPRGPGHGHREGGRGGQGEGGDGQGGPGGQGHGGHGQGGQGHGGHGEGQGAGQGQGQDGQDGQDGGNH